MIWGSKSLPFVLLLHPVGYYFTNHSRFTRGKLAQIGVSTLGMTVFALRQLIVSRM